MRRQRTPKQKATPRFETLEPRAMLAADLVGDFNNDRVVNTADYAVWRDTQGQTVEPGAGADASGNGVIDRADRQLWIDNVGRTAPASQGATPQLTANSLSVQRGQSIVLSSSHLRATDADSADSGLAYTLSAVTGGRFERIAAPGTAITSFTQGEIDRREVRFVHDNSMAAPSYRVSVSDGCDATTAQAATVTFSHGHSHTPGAEFQAALDLVTDAQATHRVVASGAWTDPAVWEDGLLPGAGARIVIPNGLSVTVDSELSPEYETIRIDGTLRFATDVNTQLKVDTLVSTRDGLLEIGTAAIPIRPDVTARVVFADDGAIDTTVDVAQIGRGAVLHGTTTVYGAETTGRVTLASHPAAGATSLELSTIPTGWGIGDQIVITGTQGSTSDEVRTIRAINGATVQLDQALQLDHIAPRSDLNVYVANTTRNVDFSSENTQTDRRGHIMFMHTLNVDVNHASFTELGRTDKNRELDDIFFNFAEDVVGNETSANVVFTTERLPDPTNVRGRYAVHFHRGGNDPNSNPAQITGSVVDGSPGWGFVNHSGHVNIIGNVAYRVQGAAFYTEAGDEIGSIVDNIAIRTVSPTFTLDDGGAIDPDLQAEGQNFGVDGDGYWLSGHLVSLRGNVSAGASGHGIIIWSDGLVEADRGRATVRTADIANGNLITGRDTIPTWWAPLAEITGNESYGATVGFRSRYVHSSVYLGENGSPFHERPDQAYIDTLNPVIDGLTVWGSRDGVLLNYNERLSIANARLIGVGAPWVQNGGTADTGVGIDLYNEISRGPGRIENVSIEGFGVGLLAPRQDEWMVNNLQLANTTDLVITEARQSARVLDLSNVTFGSLDGTAVQNTAGQRQNVLLQADTEGDGFQPYFFLLRDQIRLNGQSLYFDQQAADHVPLEFLDPESLISPVSQEFVGRTNQQLWDRYGTSFGGAIVPADAVAVSFVDGGLVGSAPTATPTTPPLYDMTNEGAAAILVDPGNLTNFTLPQQTEPLQAAVQAAAAPAPVLAAPIRESESPVGAALLRTPSVNDSGLLLALQTRALSSLEDPSEEEAFAFVADEGDAWDEEDHESLDLVFGDM